MKKLTAMLILAILSLGSISAFAGGDEWSTKEALVKEKTVKKKTDDKNDKKEDKKQQSSND